MHKVALEKPTLALKAANFFGVFGYISLLIEWVLLICIIAYPAIKNGSLNWIMPAKNPTPAPIINPAPANDVTMLVGIIITVICLGIAVYAIYTIPRSIGKVGAKITHNAAATVVPALTHHRKITKKSRLKLTLRTVTVIKLTMLILPLAVVLVVPSFTALSKDVVMLTTLFMASWALFNFTIQLTLTKFAKLNPDQVW